MNACAPLACSFHSGQKRDSGSPETVVTDGCELPPGCWQLNPGLLEEQPVLLTTESGFLFVLLFLFCVCTFLLLVVGFWFWLFFLPMCSPDCPGTSSVDQAGLKLT